MSLPASPFKFLDSYQQDDRDIFFGRDKEINDLYNALSGVKQLLLYGPSGSGKTSLIECGLRNQFSDADWFALTIRRGNNLNQSFFKEINKELRDKIELDETGMPTDKGINFGQAAGELFSDRYQPVYLLFDQFEELLILGDEDEKKDFFTRLNQLIRYKVPCRVILIMREEFIGYLSEYEYLCPAIFQHRFRLEKMGKKYVREVILGILNAPEYRASFEVADADKLCESILSKLPDNSQEIELAHVQVFFGELWDRALKEKNNNIKPMLHPGLIEDNDNLESVLDVFLKKQFEDLEPKYGKNAALEVLGNMITERNTKLQIDEQGIQKELDNDAVILNAPLAELLANLETRRIIRTSKAGAETKYEISHDILALLVGKSRTEDMLLREKAEGIYKIYEKRTDFLSQSELNYLQPYERYKAYPDDLKTLIDKSAKQIEFDRTAKELEQKRRLKRARMVAVVISILAIGAAGAAFYGFNMKREADNQRQIAEKQKTVAETALLNFKIAQAAKDSIQFKELDARANTILEVNGRPLEILDTMKTIYEFYCDSVKTMHWIKPRIDSIQTISDSHAKDFKLK